MAKDYYFILNKSASLTISVSNIENHTKEEYSYEEFVQKIIKFLTPNDLTNQVFLKEIYDNKTLEDKLIEYSNSLSLKKFIKDLKLDANILKIDCYNLDNFLENKYVFIISNDLLEDKKFQELLSSCIKTYEINKNFLAREFFSIKKQKENQDLIKASIDDYLNAKKKFNISQEEAILLEHIYHNKFYETEFFNYFNSEYKLNHQLKTIFYLGLPIIIVISVLGIYLKSPSNIMKVVIYILLPSLTFYFSEKKWLDIIYNKIVKFIQELEDNYGISYDMNQKRIILNKNNDVFDDFLKCLNSTYELAYGKITTPLEDEIVGLNSLSSEYHEKDKSSINKIYFMTRLLTIKKQILLKESTIDKKVSSYYDEVSFIERFIKYFTGKRASSLNDVNINNCLEKIKKYVEEKRYIFAVDLQMSLVEYLYENYKSQEESEVVDIEYAVDLVLGRKLKVR